MFESVKLPDPDFVKAEPPETTPLKVKLSVPLTVKFAANATAFDMLRAPPPAWSVAPRALLVNVPVAKALSLPKIKV